MADISQYRVSPPAGLAPNGGAYDPTLFVQQQAMARNASLPPIREVPAAAPLDIPNGGASAGAAQKGEWNRILDEATKSQGFTPEAFDALASEYKRSRVAPFAALRDMSEAQRDAFIGGFDAQASKDKARLFKDWADKAAADAAAAPAAKGEESGLGTDLYNLGKAAVNTVGSGVSQTLGMVLAGVDRINPGNALANLGDKLIGQPGRTARQREAFIDSIFKHLVDPDKRAENFLGGKSAEQLARESISLPETDPRYANLLKAQTENWQQQLAEYGGTGFRGALERNRDEAREESPIASGIGTGAGIIAEALLTRRIPGVSAALDSVRGANLGTRVLAELPVGAAVGQQMAGDAAVSNVNRGDDLGNVLAQYGVDLGLNTALAALPPSLRGGLLTRVGSGAALAAGQTELQSAVDAAVNPNNTYNPLESLVLEDGSINPDGLANLIIGGGLGGIAGGRSVNRNGKRPATPAKTPQAAPQAPDAGGATPAAPEAQTANVGAWDSPAATPLGDEPLASLSDRLDGRLKTKSTRYKNTVPKIGSADDFVNAALEETQTILGDSWNKLSNAQRVDMVEKTVETMRKRSKLEGIGAAFTALKNNVLAAPAATAAPATPAAANIDPNAVVSPEEALGLRTPQQAPAAEAPATPAFDEAAYIAKADALTPAELAALKSVDERIDTSKVAPQVARTILARTNKLPPEVTGEVAAAKRKTGKKQENLQRAETKVVREPKPKTADAISKDYYKSLFNYAAGNETGMFGDVTAQQVSSDPNIAAVRDGIRSGEVTDADTMQGYLANRGLQDDAQAPRSKGEHDNRIISKLISSGKKAEQPAKAEARRLRDRGKELGLKANDLKNMTLGALRASVDDLETQLGKKAPPKTEATKRRTGKKVETKPKDTSPKPTAPKAPENLKLHELESALNEQGADRDRTASIRKLKDQADQLESDIIGLQNVRAKQLKKGGRTRAELRDMTTEQLEKYRNELRADSKELLDKKAAEDEAKAKQAKDAEGKKKSIKINRAHNDGMGDILSLGKDGTEGAVNPVGKDTLTAIQKSFTEAVGTGKTSALREKLISADVFGAKIDDIVKSAKNAHEAELGRIGDAKDAFDKPLPKAAKSKILRGFLDYKDGSLSKTKFRELVQSLTKDETGKGLEARLIELADTEKAQLADRMKALETEQPPRPKAQAPKKGAAKNNPAKRELSGNAKTLGDRVTEAVAKSDLSKSERVDLDAALKLAQQGDSKELNAVLKTLVDAESITAEQAKVLRALGTEKQGKPLQSTRNAIDELLKGQDDNIDGDLEPTQRIAQQQKTRLDSPYNDITLVDDSPSGRMARAMDSIWEKAEQGKLTPQEAQSQIEVLKKDYDARMNAARLAENNTPARGAKAIKDRLRQIKQANPGNKRVQRATDFALWLVDQNPNLVSRVNLALDADLRAGAAGKMSPDWDGDTRIAKLVLNADPDKVNTTTAVHEIMHAAELMMPKELQDRLRGEYIGRLLNKVKQVTQKGKLAERDYLRDVIRHNAEPTKETYEAALSHILHGKVNADEFYKYFNPSEYWAEEATSILSRKHRAANSWLPKVREWAQQYVERVKNLFGMDNNDAVYRGLKDVLKGRGVIRNTSSMLRQGDNLNADMFPNLDVTDVDEGTRKTLNDNNIEVDTPETEDGMYERTDAQAKAENTKQRSEQTKGWENISWAQRAWENMAYAGYPLEQAKVALAKKGIKVPFETDPAEQLRLKDGRTSRNNDIDTSEVVQPVDQYLEDNWGQYANDKAEFVTKLNDFFGLTNLQERAHTAWLLNTKLTDGKGWARDNIIEDVREGDITPEAGRAKLESLVKKYSDVTEQDYVQNYIPEIDEYTARLKELSDDGIDTKSMQELNGLLDNVRTRQRERLVESGQVGEDDVWTRFYGWKWYVPLKGTSTVDADPRAQASFDIIPPDKLALAKLNGQYKAMKGRGSEGEQPFERLFVDLARSGERAANGHFMRSLYELVLDNQKELGAYIYTLDGNPHDGYTDSKGNTFARLPTPKDGLGFIVNDGDVHHVITLNAARKSGDNAASQLIRGLVTSNDVLRPTGGMKSVARVTNTLARNYTTMSPTWQLFKGFVRDLTTIPMTMGVENFSGPVDAASFGGRFVKELSTSYDSLKVLAKQVGAGMQDYGVYGSIDNLAKSNPEGYAGWVKRYLDAGGSNAFTQGFELDSISRNFAKSLKNKADIAGNTENSASERAAAAAGVALTPYTKWGEMTSNWAQFLELIPRVAAFKAFKETKNVSDAEAAVAVRRVMDYQQSGRWGRNINALLAFYRTGMTGLDVMRRSFRNPKTGKTDWNKAGKWGTVMPVFGYAAYQALAATLGDDEDGIAKIKKLRPSTLTQYMVLPFADDKGRPYGASIGLGLPQVLMAPGALAAAVEAGHITKEEAIKELAATYKRNGTPINRETISASLTATQPLVDLNRNRDSFDRPIHTEHPDKKKPRWMQGRQNTAGLYKDVAEFAYNASDKVSGGMYQSDMYPEDVRYLMSSYGGQMVTDLLKSFVDAPELEEAGIENTTNMLTGRAVVKDADYYDVERLYRLMGQYERLERKVNNVARGDAEARTKYLEENPDIAAALLAGKALQTERLRRDKNVKKLRDDNNSLGRRAALRKQYDSSLREASGRLETALEKTR